MATIDAKLSALLKVALEDPSRPAPNGPELTTPSPAPPWRIPSQPIASPAPPASEDDLARTLNEIACLLALVLKRKSDLADVVADLDSVGFDRARIGELLGISPSHVDAALVSYDRRDRKRRRKRN